MQCVTHLAGGAFVCVRGVPLTLYYFRADNKCIFYYLLLSLSPELRKNKLSICIF